MTPAELNELVSLGAEQSGVEFKGPCALADKPQRDKILRAMLAMANHRDGGLVIVGVDESGTGLLQTGLTPEQLATWTRDLVGDAIAAYADPPIDFDVELVRAGERAFVILRIRQFSDVPVVCKRNGAQAQGKLVLREGACYVRPRRKPESVEVPTAADMRDLLDLAIDRGVETFIKRMHRAGGVQPTATAAPDLYAAQRAVFEEEPLLPKIRKLGHWRFEMFAGAMQARRVPSIQTLDVLMRQLRIRAQRSYPCSPETGETRHGDDFTGQARDMGNALDAWRLWQSGLFIHERALRNDWQDHAPLVDPKALQGWQPGQELDVAGTVTLLCQVYEFAARLSRSSLGDIQLFVRIEVKPLTGRTLRFPKDWFAEDRHRSKVSSWRSSTEPIPTAELVSNHRVLARAAAQELFYRFGWEVTPEVLRGLQDRYCPEADE